MATLLAAPTAVTAGRVAAWRRTAWAHPEWWMLALCSAAWAGLIAIATQPNPHAHHVGMWPSWSGLAMHWEIMVVAMMLPLLVEPVRHVAARSFWGRRHRAIAGFLSGYLALWALAALPLMGTVYALRGLGFAVVVAGCFGFAAIWQTTSWKRRLMMRGHATMPLAPLGWRADRDCFVHGVRTGLRCFGSCWALMLACTASGHGLLAMAGLCAVGISERYSAKPDQRTRAAAIAALGASTLLL